MNLRFWCAWLHCRCMASAQVVIPAPPELGGKAVAWLCPDHEKRWETENPSGLLWANYAFGRPPIIGDGRLTQGWL